MDYSEASIISHKTNKGHLEIHNKISIKNKNDLSIAYTPGIAAVCLEIKNNKNNANELTSAKNTVAVISDGSAVLGLGNIGADAAIPIMEGKCVLFKKFGNIDAHPIVLNTQDTEEIIKTIKIIAPSFGGINLEDISAPRCFEIEERLNKELDIPVFHDDQHGTAIVVLAGLINSLKITDKKKEHIKVIINGAGAAGIAITKLLYNFGIKNIILCDSSGIISSQKKNLNPVKKDILQFTNKENLSGTLQDALKNADVFIGVSKGNILTANDIKSMAPNPIIFAMANPIPEIMPDMAENAGAQIIATGRSDFPNQLNNLLVFPGIFKGALKTRTKNITTDMKIAAAISLAECVNNSELNENKIIPSIFDKDIADIIANSIINFNKK